MSGNFFDALAEAFGGERPMAHEPPPLVVANTLDGAHHRHHHHPRSKLVVHYGGRHHRALAHVRAEAAKHAAHPLPPHRPHEFAHQPPAAPPQPGRDVASVGSMPSVLPDPALGYANPNVRSPFGQIGGLEAISRASSGDHATPLPEAGRAPESPELSHKAGHFDLKGASRAAHSMPTDHGRCLGGVQRIAEAAGAPINTQGMPTYLEENHRTHKMERVHHAADLDRPTWVRNQQTGKMERTGPTPLQRSGYVKIDAPIGEAPHGAIAVFRGHREQDPGHTQVRIAEDHWHSDHKQKGENPGAVGGKYADTTPSIYVHRHVLNQDYVASAGRDGGHARKRHMGMLPGMNPMA